MTAPERIWAAPPTDDPEWESGSGEWDVSENWAASCITEYVRADLAAVPAQVIDPIHRMDAIQACQVGPSDEWSKATKSGYEQAATDCQRNILRIKPAAIEPQPDPRDEVIARLVEALEMMRSTYPYNPPCYGWQEQVEAHKTAKAALAAANPSYHQNQKGK